MTTNIKRNIYLTILSIKEAYGKVIDALPRATFLTEQPCPSHEASGRVLARPVHAHLSSPPHHSAAMDGYALTASASFGARESHPVMIPLHTSDTKEGNDADSFCYAVNTGNPLPISCDAVVMIEHVQPFMGEAASVASDDSNAEPVGILIEQAVAPWQHVRRMGEDIIATELLFARYHLLRPWDVGALLSGGIWDVPVWEQIRVRIIPTGDELIDFTLRTELQIGQIVESNASMLGALLHEEGCYVERHKPVPDDPEALHAALRQSLDDGMHVTILCAGSSAGSKDFTRATIEREGEVLVHGIRAMPGKPSLIGVCRDRLVIGAPGYPVSALVCFQELVLPLLRHYAYKECEPSLEVPVVLARTVPSRVGMAEYVRLMVGRVGDRRVAIPLPRGAGNISSVTRAHACVCVPEASEGLAEGDTVMARLSVPEITLDTTLLCVGSHDNVLDLLSDELRALSNPCHLASSHVGSMGGLTALKKNLCHCSGMHLFDPQTQTFNTVFIKQYLPDTPVTLINLVIRQQGLILPKGNPLGIKGIEAVKDVRFLNRQRGAGTRILFDHLLKENNIQAHDVNGYDKEEFTHMAVALNVLMDTVDCGMGVYAAAKALDLDFIPITQERYDLVIPNEFLDDPRIQTMLTLLRDKAFHTRIKALGGYDTSLTGTTM